MLKNAQYISNFTGGKIYLLHVIKDPMDSIYGVDPNIANSHNLIEVVKEKVSNMLLKLADDAMIPLEHITIIVKVGNPGEKIFEFLETEKIDLIVMTTHGRKGLSRMLMGSVAEHVVRNATIPVLMCSKIPVNEEMIDR